MIDIIIVTETVPMSSRVVAAFRLLGFLNAGTPLLIASTPVRAAQPEEKARSSRKSRAKPARLLAAGSGTSSNLRTVGLRQAPGQRPREPEERHADDRRP